jgi:predicted permease
MLFKQTARRIARGPLFYLFAVLSLGMGLGVCGSAQAVVAGLGPRYLLEGRRANVDVVARGDGQPAPDWRATLSFAAYQRLVDSGVAHAAASVGSTASVRTAAAARIVLVESVTPSYFELLRLVPAAGRMLTGADDRAPVVVVSAAIADQIESESGRRAVGGLITIQDVACEIVGVLPRDFRGLTTTGSGTDVWLPLGLAQRAGVTAADPHVRQATVLIERNGLASHPAALTTLQQADRDDAPPSPGNARDRLSIVHAETIATDGLSARQQWTLVAVASLILVVGVLNLANLSLARSLRREQEIRVKLSLGASWARLIWDEASESLVVAVIAALVASAATGLFATTWSSTMPISQGQVIDVVPRIGVATAALLGGLPVMALLFIGLVPAVRVVATVRGGRRLTAAGYGASVAVARPGRMLIRWQIAAIGVLVFIGVVASGPLRRLASHDTGMRLDDLAVAGIDVSTVGQTERPEAMQRIVSGVLHVAGVSAVTMSSGMPFGVHAPMVTLRVSGPERSANQDVSLSAVEVEADEQFFATTGMAIVAGRGIEAQDRREGRPVVVVSQSIARRAFDGRDPVGRTVAIDDGNGKPRRFATVVGVTRETDVVRIGSRNGGVVFTPMASDGVGFPTLTVRGNIDSRLLGDIRNTIATIDRRVDVSAVGTGRQLLAPVLVTLDHAATLTLACGGAALLLAMIGLYGIMAQLVEVRRREIGIRLAIGATGSELKRWMLRTGVGPVVEGLSIALAVIGCGYLFLAITRGGGGEYAVDVVRAFLLTALMLGVSAVSACWIPAVRASKTSPRELFAEP